MTRSRLKIALLQHLAAALHDVSAYCTSAVAEAARRLDAASPAQPIVTDTVSHTVGSVETLDTVANAPVCASVALAPCAPAPPPAPPVGGATFIGAAHSPADRLKALRTAVSAGWVLPADIVLAFCELTRVMTRLTTPAVRPALTKLENEIKKGDSPLTDGAAKAGPKAFLIDLVQRHAEAGVGAGLGMTIAFARIATAAMGLESLEWKGDARADIKPALEAIDAVIRAHGPARTRRRRGVRPEVTERRAARAFERLSLVQNDYRGAHLDGNDEPPPDTRVTVARGPMPFQHDVPLHYKNRWGTVGAKDNVRPEEPPPADPTPATLGSGIPAWMTDGGRA